MNLKLALLTLLDQAGGYLLPDETLLQNLLLQAPRATRTDAAAQLRELEALGWAVSIPSRLEAQHRWGLTDEGRAELRQKGL